MSNLTGLEIYRLVMGFVFMISLLVFFVLMVLYMRRSSVAQDRLLTKLEDDRAERQASVSALNKQSIVIAADVQRVLEATAAAEAHRDQLWVDLYEKIDDNTSKTVESANASKAAINAANSLNEKIHATQNSLLEVAKHAKTQVNIDLGKKDTSS